jgi:hypothetical protein
VWQRKNVTAFLVSGIAGTVPGVVGQPYRDASGNKYLTMFVQPVLVYEADRAALRRASERALSRESPGHLHARAPLNKPRRGEPVREDWASPFEWPFLPE